MKLHKRKVCNIATIAPLDPVCPRCTFSFLCDSPRGQTVEKKESTQTVAVLHSTRFGAGGN